MTTICIDLRLACKIRCDYCHQVYDFEDDTWGGHMGSAEVLPDGYLFDGKWMCDDCGSCKECGASLEKEPYKRGPNGSKVCRYCMGEAPDGLR